MQILEKSISNIIFISVIGDVNEDKLEIFTEILNRDFSLFEITFLDAKILPLNLIKIFIKHQKKSKIKIVVLKYQLFSYLVSLGIYAHLLPQKSIFKQKEIKAIGIGGSTDSLNKIISIIRDYPDSNVTIFILQHIKSDVENLLDKLLQNVNHNFKIKIAQHREVIKGKTIYIAPSSRHMIIKENHIELVNSESVNFAKPSIDMLFNSLANRYKDSLIAVLLCGYGVDGFKSLADVRANGGVIVLEDMSDCSANTLIKEAIKQDIYDYIKPLNELKSFLYEYTILEPDTKLIDEFLEQIYIKYGYDYREYQIDSITRRVKLLMSKEKISNFYELKLETLNNPSFFEKIFLEFSITVSRFFRDSSVYSYIRERILPYLDSFSHIKIWCAGCSSGEEPYSIAIILKELGILHKSLIYATDINPFILNIAKNGIYPKRNFDIIKESYKKSNGVLDVGEYFYQYGEVIEVKPEIKDKILFFQHSLVNSGVFNDFQLIICRNVMIYFNQNLQTKILNLFFDSLDRSGFLVLGKSEKIQDINFEILERDLNIYKKNRF